MVGVPDEHINKPDYRVVLFYAVDGQKVPDVHRRLICQKVSVSRNLSQKVIPLSEGNTF